MKRSALRELRLYLVIIVGTVISAIGYALFQVPHGLAAGGVSGVAILINHLNRWPVGVMVFFLNIPLMILGFKHLGRWRFLMKTVFAVGLFSVLTDVMLARLPGQIERFPISDDVLLSSIYAGVIGGVGLGMIFGAGGSLGGTGVVGRILQHRWGIPLSTAYLYTDGLVILVAGLILGWEAALFALLTLIMFGVASDYILEGPSSIRTATIVTNNPETVGDALIARLGRGASCWNVTGVYSKQQRAMIMCTVSRTQVNELKYVLGQTDPEAFLTIGVGHQAYGGNFSPLDRSEDPPADSVLPKQMPLSSTQVNYR